MGCVTGGGRQNRIEGNKVDREGQERRKGRKTGFKRIGR